MPFSMRVVDTAAHFGACPAEEMNPVAPTATLLDCGSACLDSRAGNAERSFFAVAFQLRLKFDQYALLTA